MSDAAQGFLREALRALLPGEELEGAEPLGRGHIHDTLVALCRAPSGARARYVVQRLNAYVFRDPPALAANLERVTAHLREAQRARGVSDPERRCLRPVVSPEGRTLHRDRGGNWWRAFPFVERTRSIESPRSAQQAVDAARAFGRFLADLADLAPERLIETIPHFHDLGRRLAALERAAAQDALGRAANVAAELAASRRAGARLQSAPELAAGALPRRVVHNDCKLNNLLLDDASGEAMCVVDLDTVMPGSVLFDFGELARSGACPAAEDERDLARVRLDRELFAALAHGFVEGSGDLLSGVEIRALPLAGPLMALENGVRFLTDHLEGDRYFRVARPGQNLDRARAQLRLVDCMLAAEAELRALFARLASARRG